MSEYSFMWDLDGTLLKSYDVIVSSFHRALSERGYEISEKAIMYDVQKYSIPYFTRKLKAAGIPDVKKISRRYDAIANAKMLEVPAAPNALEILEWLKSNGMDNYVFTHRGESTWTILKNIKMDGYFREIITAEQHFPRKPHPDALNYLIDKYSLDRQKTFYVGDRSLDIECGKAAGLKTILFIPEYSYGEPDGTEDYVIKDFLEIKKIVSPQ